MIEAKQSLVGRVEIKRTYESKSKTQEERISRFQTYAELF